MSVQFSLSADHAGRRVDRVLRVIWKDVPLGVIMKALRTGSVRLDGKKTAGDQRVQEGQMLYVPWDLPEKSVAIQKETKKMPSLQTLYRDEALWCINKESGVLTQPNVAGGDSLITRVWNELEWDRVDFRPACVHRLDRNTSGLVMVALTGGCLRLLTELLREQRIKKIYWAIVEGIIPERGSVELALRKDGDKNQVFPDKAGESALTHFKRLSVASNCSLVELELVTGRAHQARAHMAAIGFPILGDVKYGKGSPSYRVGRPFLHAYSVLFPEVKELGMLSGKQVTAPLFPDMDLFIQNSMKNT